MASGHSRTVGPLAVGRHTRSSARKCAAHLPSWRPDPDTGGAFPPIPCVLGSDHPWHLTTGANPAAPARNVRRSQPPRLVSTVVPAPSRARCTRIALLVDTLPSLVNQGSVLLATKATWARVAFSYLVPRPASDASAVSDLAIAPGRAAKAGLTSTCPARTGQAAARAGRVRAPRGRGSRPPRHGPARDRDATAFPGR
jgi:hypothetical protein